MKNILLAITYPFALLYNLGLWIRKAGDYITENSYIVSIPSGIIMFISVYLIFQHKTMIDYAFIAFMALLGTCIAVFFIVLAAGIIPSVFLAIMFPFAKLHEICGGECSLNGYGLSEKAIRKMMEREKNASYCNIEFK